MLSFFKIKNEDIVFRFPSDAEWLFVLTTLFCVITSFFFIPLENLNSYGIYIAFFLGSLFFIFCSDLTKNSLVKLILYSIGIFLFGFLMAFRNKTGIDDPVYESLYVSVLKNGIIYTTNHSDIEKGYFGLYYVLSLLNVTDYLHVQTIICYISFLFWGAAFWKYHNLCNLSVMFLLLWSHYYFFVLYAGLVRLFIALPIALIAINYITLKKLKHALFFILLAASFHRSAFIILLFIPLFHEKIIAHWKVYIVVLFCTIPFIFIFIAKLLVPVFGARYSLYADIGTFKISIGAFDTLPIALIGIYFSQFVDKSAKKQYIVGLFLVILSMVFSIWSSLVSLGRLIFFANLGVLIIASNIFKQKPVGIIEKFSPCIFVIYSFVYVLHTSFLNPNSTGYLFPYISYLE